jgi:hypothetical protein
MVVLLATAACGSTGDGGGSSSADKPASGGANEAPMDGVMQRDLSGDGYAAKTTAQTIAVISTGTVSLQSDDVGAARFDVQKIVDLHRGTIAEEETTTGDDGKPETSRMVLRIPSNDFSKVTKELEGVADLIASSSGSEDVTTQVIDNEVRIRAQTKSLERIEALLAQATNLREVVAIESQLTRRQADLDSLKSQQAYLADQTTLSTVTVSIERTHEKKADKKEATGFVRGLSAGWGGFVAAMVGLATVLGFLLPFALVLALFGVPIWLVQRNVRRRRPEAESPAL